MADFLTRSLRCPACNTEFSIEVPAPGRLVERETDFRPRHEFADPIAVAIDSCPSCHFTAYATTFGWHPGDEDDEAGWGLSWNGRLPAALPVPDDDVLEDLRRAIRRNEHLRGLQIAGREPNAVEKYIIGTHCFELLRERDILGAADYWLRGSWCARTLKDARAEQRCQREAIARFASALDERQIPEKDLPRATYLIGELSRRAGDFSRAIDFYGRVNEIADPDDHDGRLIRSLAQRQVSLASAKSAVNAVIDTAADSDEEGT